MKGIIKSLLYSFVIADEDEDETCDQTKQNPRQVSLYYVAEFCRRIIFSLGSQLVLQYKGGGCYLIGSFIYPCFLCHIIKLRLFRFNI